MATQHLASIGGASARNGRLARDADFGLYVGKVPRRALAGGAKSHGLPFLMRKVWLRLREATGQAMGAVAFAFLAAAMAALFAGIVFVGRAGTGDLAIAPPSHRASLHNAAARPDGHARMAVDPLIVAEASAQTTLHVAVARPGDVPDGSFVRVRGLPPATSLSRGHAMGPGTWAVPLAELAGLKLNAAAAAAGKAKVTFTLVAAHGEQLAQARTTLVLQTTPRATPAARAVSARLVAEPVRAALRPARGEPAHLASSAARDATPRPAPGKSMGRKQRVQHIAKRNHQIASRARKVKAVRTVERTFEDAFILLPFFWWAS